MKIIKEEKHLYKFLKTVFDIQKSAKQKYIIGNYGFLYFYTPYRSGKFYQKSEKRIAMEYNFNEYASYTLSQLPNGDFELRENDALVIEQMINYMAKINDILNNAKFRYCIDKDDTCQLAKMTSLTHKMLCDDDMKYFRRFEDVEVFQNEDYLIADSNVVDDDLNIHVSLAFNTCGHEVELQVQEGIFKTILDAVSDEVEEEPKQEQEVPAEDEEVENENCPITDYKVETSFQEELETDLDNENPFAQEEEEPF